MALLDAPRVLLAKVEATAGTDAAPVGATDAVEIIELDLTPYESESVNRGIDTANLGGEAEVITKRRTRYAFGIQLAGAGTTAATLAAWDALMQGCGFAPGAVTTDVQHDLISSAFKTLTIHGHKDGQKHPSVYCRGDMSLVLDTGQLPRFNFDFQGLYVTPTSVANPTPTLTSWQDAVRAGNDNTTTATLHGVAIEMSSLELALNNQIVHRDVVGNESIELVQRNVEGTIKFQAPAISGQDWFSVVDNETQGALAIVQGTVAANIVELDAPNVQLLNLSYEEEDGILMISAGIRCIPGASGNDELKITTK